MLIEILSRREWEAAQGNMGIMIGNREHFPSGATCDEYGNNRVDPPTGPIELIQAKRRYWKERVKIAERAFNNHQTRFSEQQILANRYRNLPQAPSNSLEILETLKQQYHAAISTLQALDDELLSSPEGQQAQAAAEAAQQREQQERNQRSEQLTKINSMHL